MSCVCRALLAAVAVSYLMCVLLLSGMQKEDLDAKMLNKLERHNVNIHEMNNKNLLTECITNYSGPTTDDPKKQEIESDYLTHTSVVDMNTPTYKSTTNILQDNNNNKNVVKYIEGQPELQSVIKFWHDVKMPRSNPSTIVDRRAKDENVNYDQKNKRNVPDVSNSYETDSIQRLLANLLRKENIVQKTTESQINVNELYKDFLGRSKYQNSFEYQNQKNVFTTNSIMPTTITAERKQRAKTKDETSNFNDVLNAINTLKMLTLNKNDDRINNQRFSRKNENSNGILIELDTLTTTEKVETSSTGERNIQKDMIQEIAKSVKELVLKDLRKEMLQLTTSTHFTTVMSTTVTTKLKSNADDRISKGGQISEQAILNKFIDLFEEIKSLNRKTVIISSEIRNENKVTNNEPSVQTYPQLPVGLNGHPITSYGINHYANFKIQKTYDFLPQLHKFRSNIDLKSEKHSIKSTQPITFQTNNMEIPPLGIPVDEHELPINQNIIVSTVTPYRIGDYRFDSNKIKHSRIDTNAYTDKLSKTQFLKTKEPSIHQLNQDVESLPFHNEFPNYNRISYKGTSKKDDFSNHYPKIPRFHEKLEKSVDFLDIPEPKEQQERMDCCNEKFAFSKQMVDCCNHKVASRQQMSLNAMKKQSYDDTHFKNFLKSQQKVTDMLERVLASRSRVKSVEMT